MAEIVFFHHVRGLTPGITAIADAFREAGHTVHTPDLFEGKTFPDLHSGLAHVRSIGFATVIERGASFAEELPAGLVYAGYSMGVLPAQMLAQTRRGAKGALLLESCVPVTEFSPSWPAGVPVQVHGMDADPSFALEGDIDAARALVASNPADAELFVYAGDKHLFADPSLESFDPVAAALLMSRTLTFLARVGQA
jgi:dienelactone hydrolase